MLSKNLVLAVGAAAALGAGVYVWHKQRAGKNGKKGADSTEYLAPALTEEETLRVMQAIMDKLKMMAMRMMQAKAGIRAQMEQQGHEMDDRKLMKTFIYPHFIDQLQDIQTNVLAEHEVDESELEDAVHDYIGSDSLSAAAAGGACYQIREIVRLIKKYHYDFGGEKHEDEDEEEDEAAQSEGDKRVLTLEELLEVIHTLSVRIGEQMDDYIIAFKAEHGLPDESTMEAFHHGFMNLTVEIEKQTTKELDVTLPAFQKAVEMYSDNIQLQMAFQQMQMVSAEKMAAHGIR